MGKFFRKLFFGQLRAAEMEVSDIIFIMCKASQGHKYLKLQNVQTNLVTITDCIGPY